MMVNCRTFSLSAVATIFYPSESLGTRAYIAYEILLKWDRSKITVVKVAVYPSREELDILHRSRHPNNLP
jgi:hypothetical protein